MTIKIIKKDLFTIEDNYYLAHCISADFALGAGIAKTFNSKYDMRFKLFNNYPNYVYRGGDALLVDNVFNLVTKAKCFQKPTYESLTEALEMMRDKITLLKITNLAMPMIGCGLDRLQWSRVKNIIESVFIDTDINILICTI
jgi:O-acetyl-ADP-ribose deacetylase (regulator of RNase III)